MDVKSPTSHIISFDARNYTTRTAEVRVNKFCTLVEYIKC